MEPKAFDTLNFLFLVFYLSANLRSYIHTSSYTLIRSYFKICMQIIIYIYMHVATINVKRGNEFKTKQKGKQRRAWKENEKVNYIIIVSNNEKLIKM